MIAVLCFFLTYPDADRSLGSRYCHGINCAQNPSMTETACLRQSRGSAKQIVARTPGVYIGPDPVGARIEAGYGKYRCDDVSCWLIGAFSGNLRRGE
jgi:hypothetical protein